jgi:hypothetical protein
VAVSLVARSSIDTLKVGRELVAQLLPRGERPLR